MICCGMLVLSLITWFACMGIKSGMKDSGTLGIKSVADAMSFLGGATIHNPQDDQTWNGENGFTIEKYLAAPEIFIVSPKDKLRQYDYLMEQTVQVTQVLKGSQTTVGKNINLLNYGFADDYRGLRYYSTTNILIPGRSYMIFVTPQTNYNQYSSVPVYSYSVYGPGAFDIDEEHVSLIETTETDTLYQTVKDMDYFVAIPEMLDAVKQIREDLLEHFQVN